jgi:hypothetical protein
VGPETFQVRLFSTLPIYVTFGTTAVSATANSDTLLPANVVEYYTISPGQCLGFISTSTCSGYCSLTEIS